VVYDSLVRCYRVLWAVVGALLSGSEKCFDCTVMWLLGCSRWLFTG